MTREEYATLNKDLRHDEYDLKGQLERAQQNIKDLNKNPEVNRDEILKAKQKESEIKNALSDVYKKMKENHKTYTESQEKNSLKNKAIEIKEIVQKKASEIIESAKDEGEKIIEKLSDEKTKRSAALAFSVMLDGSGIAKEALEQIEKANQNKVSIEQVMQDIKKDASKEIEEGIEKIGEIKKGKDEEKQEEFKKEMQKASEKEPEKIDLSKEKVVDPEVEKKQQEQERIAQREREYQEMLKQKELNKEKGKGL